MICFVICLQHIADIWKLISKRSRWQNRFHSNDAQPSLNSPCIYHIIWVCLLGRSQRQMNELVLYCTVMYLWILLNSKKKPNIRIGLSVPISACSTVWPSEMKWAQYKDPNRCLTTKMEWRTSIGKWIIRFCYLLRMYLNEVYFSFPFRAHNRTDWIVFAAEFWMANDIICISPNLMCDILLFSSGFVWLWMVFVCLAFLVAWLSCLLFYAFIVFGGLSDFLPFRIISLAVAFVDSRLCSHFALAVKNVSVLITMNMDSINWAWRFVFITKYLVINTKQIKTNIMPHQCVPFEWSFSVDSVDSCSFYSFWPFSQWFRNQWSFILHNVNVGAMIFVFVT